MTAGRTSLYFDLLDGFAQPGCSVCRFTLRAVERFFDSLTYENTNDIAIRDSVRAARGFCNRHTEQYLGYGDELGAAFIYRDLLHTVIPALERATADGLASVVGQLADPSGQRRAVSALRALAPTESCLACRRLQEAEEHYLSTLLQHLRTQEFAAAFAASDALCAVHLAMALDQTPVGATRNTLIVTQRRRLDALLAQHDAGTDDAPLPAQAVATAVGGKGLRP